MKKSRIEEIKLLLKINEDYFVNMEIDNSTHTFNVHIINDNDEIVDTYTIGLTELYNKIFEDDAEFSFD